MRGRGNRGTRDGMRETILARGGEGLGVAMPAAIAVSLREREKKKKGEDALRQPGEQSG